MTTAQSIITDAFREANLIPVGASPTTDESTEALRRLNSYIKGVFGYEMGEELTDWNAPSPQRTAPYQANFPQAPYPQSQDVLALGTPFSVDSNINVYPYPPANSRIVFGGVAATVYFPEAPNDGSRMAVVQGSGAGDSGAPGAVLTLDGNGRTIETSNTKTYTDPVTARAWLYRADTADWVVVTTLGLTDALPFPDDVDDLWITALAIRMCPRFNKVASAELQFAFKQALAHLRARYRQAGVTTYGGQNIPRTGQSFATAGGWFT